MDANYKVYKLNLYISETWFLMLLYVLDPDSFNCLNVFITDKVLFCSYCLKSCLALGGGLLLSKFSSYCFNWSHLVTALSSLYLVLFWWNIFKSHTTELESDLYKMSLVSGWCGQCRDQGHQCATVTRCPSAPNLQQMRWVSPVTTVACEPSLATCLTLPNWQNNTLCYKEQQRSSSNYKSYHQSIFHKFCSIII